MKRADALTRARAEGRPLTAAEGRKLFAPKPPSEHAEQGVLAAWVRSRQDRYPALLNFTAIPNAESKRSQRDKKQAEGVSPGYPDCLLDVARRGYHGLRIELKRSADFGYARGQPRPSQEAWHLRLAAEGFLVAVCWGADPAIDLLLWYLDEPVHSRDSLGDFIASTPRVKVYLP